MHRHLPPLTPPAATARLKMPKVQIRPMPLPSMPWMELGFFALALFGVMIAGQ